MEPRPQETELGATEQPGKQLAHTELAHTELAHTELAISVPPITRLPKAEQ